MQKDRGEGSGRKERKSFLKMKEEEIRPKRVFSEYLRLAEADGIQYFGNSEREVVMCPACGSVGMPIFRKHGFDYEECPACQTIFVSPRPPVEDFFRYYQESASARYFATDFYRETAAARREKLWKPKVRMVQEFLKEYGAEKHWVCDIGGGYGIFAEEFASLTGREVTVIEPGPEAAQICREKGLRVVEGFLEEVKSEQLPEGARAFVSFELFEHLHDSSVFLEKLGELAQVGDLFIFTTLSGMGIDIQALWNHSDSISLQHLNFFNPKSVEILLEKKGFRILSVRTPGKLDMDILFNRREEIQDRFLKNVFTQIDAESMRKWQQFLVELGYSSHMMVVCEKR